MISLILIVIGLLIIAAFSVWAARAEEAFWSKCRRRDYCLRTQEQITSGKSHIRWGLFAGRHWSGALLYEPIARYGPFVMNTREEIKQALRDLQNGTFV